MIHARPDYNRIQDPAVNDPSLLGEGCTPIAIGEPVFLMRAQDELFVEMVEEYASRSVRRFKTPADQLRVTQIVKCCDAHVELARRWQADHAVKPADIPAQPMTALAISSVHASLDVDLARSVHRVVRAIHDGECPQCHVCRPATDMDLPDGSKHCPDCGFTILSEEFTAAFQLFAPFMEANLNVFETWRKGLGNSE